MAFDLVVMQIDRRAAAWCLVRAHSDIDADRSPDYRAVTCLANFSITQYCLAVSGLANLHIGLERAIDRESVHDDIIAIKLEYGRSNQNGGQGAERYLNDLARAGNDLGVRLGDALEWVEELDRRARCGRDE